MTCTCNTCEECLFWNTIVQNENGNIDLNDINEREKIK